MINILAIIIFGIMAFRIYKSVSNEEAVFIEHRVTTTLKELVFLFPVGSVILLFSVSSESPLVFIFSATCFIPALIVARKNNKIFGKVGTDSVSRAQEAVTNAAATAVAGIIYVAASFILSLVITLIAK